jgi:intein/homing endonuclease
MIKYEILTPDGWSNFAGVRKTTKTGSRTIVTSSGKTLECTLDHMLQDDIGWVEAKVLKRGDFVKTKDGLERISLAYSHENKETEFYDAIEVEKSKQYYTNDIVSHNCEFLGSSNTLIDARKLRQLVWKAPLHSYEKLDIYEEPVEGHKYFMTVDVSRGSSIDYSAFLVFDVTSLPYKVVAKYRDNEISPLLYPNIIWRAGKHYNDALVLIEVNDNGQQIADILFYDLEYEGVVVTQAKGRAGIKMGGGYKTKPIRGIKQTKQTKRIGCANFKSLVEGDKLLFNDYDLIYELFRFVENKASYEAEEGEHDDLTMCGVMFGWAVAQKYFIHRMDSDVRLDLWQENKEIIEDSIAPFGFFDVNSVYKEETVSQSDFENLDIHPNSYDPDDYAPQGDNVLPLTW